MREICTQGPVLGRDGKPIYPGWSKSSEAGWGSYLVNPSEPVRFLFWRLWVYNDPGYAVAVLQSGRGDSEGSPGNALCRSD